MCFEVIFVINSFSSNDFWGRKFLLNKDVFPKQRRKNKTKKKKQFIQNFHIKNLKGKFSKKTQIF